MILSTSGCGIDTQRLGVTCETDDLSMLLEDTDEGDEADDDDGNDSDDADDDGDDGNDEIIEAT